MRWMFHDLSDFSDFSEVFLEVENMKGMLKFLIIEDT